MKPTLVDTSVWRRHFAGRLASEQVTRINELLDEAGVVLLHPWVLGELVLGGLSAKEEGLFRQLPAATVVAHEDVLEFIRKRGLTRRGIGWVDAQLLASALVHSALLWTVDGSLDRTAQELGVKELPATRP